VKNEEIASEDVLLQQIFLILINMHPFYIRILPSLNMTAHRNS